MPELQSCPSRQPVVRATALISGIWQRFPSEVHENVRNWPPKAPRPPLLPPRSGNHFRSKLLMGFPGFAELL